MISAQELHAIMPQAHRVDEFVCPLNDAMHEFDISNPLRMAAFLAQIAQESGQFQWLKEIWGPTAWQSRYDLSADLGNTLPEAIAIAKQHGSTPGKWWKGHGLIQTTGYYNHKAAGEALGLDLLNQPELIAAPVGAARSAGYFWHANGLNELADKGPLFFDSITHKINPGMLGRNERREFYDRARKVLGA